MFLLDVAPILWDIVIIAIIIFGFISGFYMGMQALLFVTIGNGLAIGLAFAFKSLLLSKFVLALVPLFSSFDVNLRFLLASNLGNGLYFLIWLIGFDLIFWGLYLVIKLTLMKKYEFNHLIVNSIGGAIINTARMGVVAGYAILIIGSGLIANRSQGINDYLVNDIPQQSIMYKFYHKIYPDIPFFSIQSSDLVTISEFNDYAQLIKYTINEIDQTKTIDDMNKVINTFDSLQPLSTSEKNDFVRIKDGFVRTGNLVMTQTALKGLIDRHVDYDFLNITFMQPKFTMILNLVNISPDVASFFSDKLADIVKDKNSVDTNLNIDGWNNQIKPAIITLLNNIQDQKASTIMRIAFEGQGTEKGLYNAKLS